MCLTCRISELTCHYETETDFFSMNLIERQRHERICSLLITIHTSWIDRKLLVPICVSWIYKVVERILGCTFKFSKVEKVDHLLSSMFNFLYPLSSPIFVKPIAQCPQILLPYSYQVKFFTVISFFETWTHLHPGKPSSNFNFAQTYTVVTWNSCLSLHIISYVWHNWVYVSKWIL